MPSSKQIKAFVDCLAKVADKTAQCPESHLFPSAVVPRTIFSFGNGYWTSLNVSEGWGMGHTVIPNVAKLPVSPAGKILPHPRPLSCRLLTSIARQASLTDVPSQRSKCSQTTSFWRYSTFIGSPMSNLCGGARGGGTSWCTSAEAGDRSSLPHPCVWICSFPVRMEPPYGSYWTAGHPFPLPFSMGDSLAASLQPLKMKITSLLHFSTPKEYGRLSSL
jgi:hypothetical protein